MDSPAWISWAGLAAVVGGLSAVVLTAPFASAYFLAYPGYDAVPFWVPSLEDPLQPLLTFASPIELYELYGRIFNFVYLLFLPAAFGLRHLHRGPGSRIARRGFALLVGGLIATFIGVAGDYWANGIGFPIEVLGLLTLAVGVTVYGVALLPSGVVPRWCAWLLVSCGPGAIVFSLLIGHIPSGPTFPFALAWLMVGLMLLFKRMGPVSRRTRRAPSASGPATTSGYRSRR
ncbi:MAG TPA: hypothetical protein VFD59_07550 [Nocardioidaceae bacterium]|nr:hypothetical protein [Nocardioidaceae bacterium]